MKIRKIPLAKIKPAKYNPRKDLKPGDPEYERIKTSIDKFGLVDPLVWNEFNGVLIGGHRRINILKAMGRKSTDCSVVHIENEAEEKELNIALNRATGEWDALKLKEVVTDLEATGKDLAWLDLEELMPSAQEEGEKPLKDPDPSEPPEKPRSKRGAIYMLGKHRLMCGDATNADDVAKLMDSNLAQMVFTDPPYGVGYEGGQNAKKRKAMIGDDTDIYEASVPMMMAHSSNAAPLYLWFPGSRGHRAYQASIKAGYTVRALLIWVKVDAHYGSWMSQYMPKSEPMLYCVKKKANWYGPTNEVTVWEYKQPSLNKYHPTQKPVDLAGRGIRNSSKKNDIVLDLFGGSGSTLIACEQLGRICHMMELDLKYVDVVRKRFWKLMTGEETGWEAGTKP